MREHGRQDDTGVPHALAAGRVEKSSLDAVAHWAASLQKLEDVSIGKDLPSHSPECVGCGPLNPAGLGLRVQRTEAGVESTHRFDARHVGAPGIAHGGAVALAFDDLFGFLLYTVGVLAVTRTLTVEYSAPFRLLQPYTFRAQVRDRDGRRLRLHAEAADESGSVAGTAQATFVAVDPAHFAPA